MSDMIHARLPFFNTGQITLCGAASGVVKDTVYTTCPECLEMLGALHQVGGDHYATLKIEPWDVMRAIQNDVFSPFEEHLRFSALKYIMRAGRKGDAWEDIEKAIHYLQKLLDERAADARVDR